MLSDNRSRIFILTATHFFADFYGGILFPLPDPTLMEHFNRSYSSVMILISCCTILINVIQPVASALLPKRGFPIILLLAPLIASLTTLIGLSNNYIFVFILLLVAGSGIGILHPEASLTVQNLSNRRVGLATSIFMSGGFLGFSTGLCVGGIWGEYLKLQYFWLLMLPAVIIAILVVMSGLHKYHPQKHENASATKMTVGNIHFFPVFIFAVLIASNLAIIYKLYPSFLVRLLGPTGQSTSGTALFLIGLSGAIGSYLWGALADRFGIGKVVITIYTLSLPFLYFLLEATTKTGIFISAILFGFSIGGTFPLAIVLARTARGASQRLKMGLSIGGAWGTGELMVVISSFYIDRFPENDFQPVKDSLQLCWICMILIIILAIYIHCKLSKADANLK